MEHIKLNKAITIGVNDAGDTISVNVEDQGFVEKFYKMVDRLQDITAKMQSPEAQALGEREQLHAMIGHIKEVMQDIDGLFGADSCKKIFGDIIPSAYLLADFFEQLTPIVEKYVGERKQFIEERYNRRRKGAQGNA